MAVIEKITARQQLDPGNAPRPVFSDALGDAVSSLGGAISTVALHAQRRHDEKDDFTARLKEQEFGAQLAGLENDAVRNAPADASGIHDSVVGGVGPDGGKTSGTFEAKFNDYLAQMPQSRRAEFAAKKELYREQASQRLAGVQLQQEQAYYRVEIDKSQSDLIGLLGQADPGDDASFAAFRQAGLDTIAKSRLPPLEKDVAKFNWEAKASDALFQLKLAKDPAFAEQAREALGLAPPAPGYNDPALPAGMRNNNPGNIKFVGQGRNRGVIGPSENTDQGDPQAVFETPEAGMAEAYRLARSKYDGGKRTANDLIAGKGGWTPGNRAAAANVARTMGVGPDDDLHLNDPDRAASFMRALVTQEHGPASQAYPDSMIRAAVARHGAVSVGRDLPIVTQHQAGRVSAPEMDGVNPVALERFRALQNAVGRSLPVVSGFRDPVRNARAGGAKSSQHKNGNALDIDVSGLSREERLNVIRQASAAGFAGIGVYENSIHVDVGSRRSWGPDHSSATVPDWAKAAIAEHMAVKGVVAGPPRASARDPRFDAIPLDRRLQLANNADVHLRERLTLNAAQVKAEYAAYKDAIDLRIATGNITDPTVIVADGRLDDGDKAQFIRAVKSQNATLAQTNADLAALRDGSLRLDAYDTTDRKRVDNMFDSAAKATTPQQRGPLVREIVQQTGVVPQPVVNTLRQQLASTAVQDVVLGAQTAAAISEINRSAIGVRDGGDGITKAADLFRHYQDIGFSPEEAARRLIDLNDPAKARERAALMDSKPVKDWVASTATEATVRDIFDPGVFGYDPALGETPAQSAAMVAEYKETLQESLADAGGDQDAAKALADRRFAGRYGSSNFTLAGKGVVTRLPPEVAYPAGTDGTHAYVRTQAIDSLAGEGIAAAEVFLQADVQTDADVRAGRPAHYQVFYRDREGLLQRYRLPFYAIPPSAGEVRQQQFDESRLRMEQNRTDLLAGRDRDANLDAFIEGPPSPGAPTSAPVVPPSLTGPDIQVPATDDVRGRIDAQRQELSTFKRQLFETQPVTGVR